ncbi:MAG: PorT family protein [Bacteroidia bacterium]|nr:PorT family protein [Bacteroidia bacterium]MCF8426350.1 PorT family protein [Bacteroidia bacterium]MCF8445751.1 PorT family protein [Bacteroidia bacterium]
MNKRLLLFAWFFVFAFMVKGQEDSTSYDPLDEPNPWTKPNNQEKTRLGVKMGVQNTYLLGSELSDKKSMIGLLGGGYGRINFNKTWSLQQEFQISFKGGNFNAGPSEIRSFRLLYLDAPIILMMAFGPKEKHKVGVGIQYSNLLNSNLYIEKKSYPTGESPKLDLNDWAPLFAYQYQFEYFAMQASAKYGLRDLNLGKPWPGNDNTFITNNQGSLHNFAVEINIIF